MVMKNLLVIIPLLFGLLNCKAQEVSNKEIQIKNAVLAAPMHQREGATIMGFGQNGELIILKEGTNDFICIADDPNKEGFSVAAYHKSLEPFMDRGRQLRKEGKNEKEIFDIREQEVKEKTLNMPDKATLYVTTGDWNEQTKQAENLYTRYVIYIPFATEESTGMPLSPLAPGAPWIMNPGTHRAHIMINPPKN